MLMCAGCFKLWLFCELADRKLNSSSVWMDQMEKKLRKKIYIFCCAAAILFSRVIKRCSVHQPNDRKVRWGQRENYVAFCFHLESIKFGRSSFFLLSLRWPLNWLNVFIYVFNWYICGWYVCCEWQRSLSWATVHMWWIQLTHTMIYSWLEKMDRKKVQNVCTVDSSFSNELTQFPFFLFTFRSAFKSLKLRHTSNVLFFFFSQLYDVYIYPHSHRLQYLFIFQLCLCFALNELRLKHNRNKTYGIVEFVR